MFARPRASGRCPGWSTSSRAASIDDDTPMLYDYLKEHGGICASHTSATGMGTDWRDVNPEYEPFVEIFQGHRNSYEHLGAPAWRGGRARRSAAGGRWGWSGTPWRMQYSFGFQASSDHISTHISYAVALAEEPTREAILDAFRRRHCYAATDNIVLDVRSGDHIMGDEFNADGPVRSRSSSTAPGRSRGSTSSRTSSTSSRPSRTGPRSSSNGPTRSSAPPGLSWYYVRVHQDDGELAWGSPIWVHFGNNPAP